jgi:hypothetical protein
MPKVQPLQGTRYAASKWPSLSFPPLRTQEEFETGPLPMKRVTF